MAEAVENFLHTLENAAKMLLYLPTETRWSRMFREVHRCRLLF